MKNREFKIKIIDKRNNSSLLIKIDSTNLSAEAIRKTIMGKVKPLSNSNVLLTFVGNKESILEIEDVYNICVAMKLIFGKRLTWDIVNKIQDTKNINAYIVVSN